jgi:2-polyprenyl-3-methyl-5-hydroxy-6-metoxy-1,4-benzoquinol methylase
MDNEGITAEPVPACPLCGREGGVLHDQLRDRIFDAPGSWTHRSCKACDHTWLDPRPSASQIARLYATYFTHTVPEVTDHTVSPVGRSWLSAYGYATSSSARGWAFRLIPGLRDIAAGEIYWLPAVPDGRLLDIGCGSGLFLARMRELGWRVCGLEPDEHAARIGRERYGLDIRSHSVDDFASGSFDAVTLHHVIEHVPDPAGLLASVYRVLGPHGQLVVVTPNQRSLGRQLFQRTWIHWDPPRHLHVFSPRSLASAARRAGFQSSSIRTSARAARFAWTASRTIGSTGRANVGRIRGPLRWQSVAFQALESVLITGWQSAGEELILTATQEGS